MHLSTKLIEQPWQVTLATVTAPPARDAVQTTTASVLPSPTATAPVSATASPAPPDLLVNAEPSQEETPAVAEPKPDEDKMDVVAAEPTVPNAPKELAIDPSMLEPVVEPEPVLAPDFAAGTGIPRFEMTITGELLPAVGSVSAVWAPTRQTKRV